MEERIGTLLDGMSDEARELAEVCIAAIRECDELKRKREALMHKRPIGKSENGSCGQKKIYGKIKSMCRERGIRMYDFARDVGISKTTLGKWDTSEPGLWKLKKVADYFGISLDELIS